MILARHGQSAFNAVFNETGLDPGIPDPGLTENGRHQAEALAQALGATPIARLIASPYSRTLETAAIVARLLQVPVVVEALVRERAFFVCDIGTPRSQLARRWPEVDFGGIEERWWPASDETEDELQHRCRRFRDDMAAAEDWSRVAVITHWGFIRGLTGAELANGELLRFDPRRRADED